MEPFRTPLAEPSDERDTLLGFARYVLGVELYDGSRDYTDARGVVVRPDWQGEPYVWFENPLRRTQGTIVAPNGSGRTTKIIAPLALAIAALHKRATVVIMLPDGTQLDEQTWPALTAFRNKLPSSWDWKYRRITTDTGSRIIGRAVDEAGRAEGFHMDSEDVLDGPLYILVDEGKSLRDEVYEAIDKCSYNGKLLCSSPGEKIGTFYDSHTKDAGLYLRRKAGLLDCPHISADRIAYLQQRYKDRPQYLRATLYGEFMDADEGHRYAVPLEWLQNCLQSGVNFDPTQGTVFFCDFAGGGDENVLARRQGNRVDIVKAWRDKNEMAAVGEFVALFRRLKAKPEQIWGDADGAGKPMCARIDEVLGAKIKRFHGGQEALEPTDYFNRTSEVWHVAGKKIGDISVILPEDGILHGQLTTRRSIYSSDGRLRIEDKETMKRRGLPSPDRGDAVCGVLAISSPQAEDPTEAYFNRLREQREQRQEDYQTLPTGDW